MKLNEITETGYYTCELDTERETIFEVIKNTDEVWLKEAPEQTLLIDEWTYEYTDEDDRKHYEIYGGNLVSVVNAEPFDVVKITDTKYTMDVSDPTIAGKCNGTSMMEDKPTRLEIAEQQLDQLKAENELLKINNTQFIKDNEFLAKRNSKLKAENEKLKEQFQAKEQECKKLKKIINEAKNSKLDLKSFLVGEAVQNEYEQQLDQLKAENDKLKKQVCGLRPELKYIIDKTCSKYNIQAKTYHEKIVEIINNLEKYEQTLIEIKVICNNNDELQGDFNIVDCDKYKLGKHNLANKILQKIKEYKVEE